MSSGPASPPFSRSCELVELESNPKTIPGQPSLPLDDDVVTEFLRRELSVSRLEAVYEYLWLAGRIGHIRPLHKQRMLKREIFITESLDMHLIWYESTIFLKPIPAALLSCEFWDRFVCPKQKATGLESAPEDDRRALFEAACGLISTYSRLIIHQSDYRIAVETGLIPDVGWDKWSLLIEEVRDSLAASNTHPRGRWLYGELRLSRLNRIYKITLRGYSYFYVYTESGAYFGKNFQWLLLIFAYSSVTLTAMQTLLATQSPPEFIQTLSYGLGLLTFALIFIALASFLVLYISLFWYHLLATLMFSRKHYPRPKIP